MPGVGRVLIVGGGISGMSLGICLRDMGVAADIVEINATWGTYGAGISLTGPALRALKRLGVLDCVEREGFCADRARFCDRVGNVIAEPPAIRTLGDDIPNGGAIMRPVLHSILADATSEAGVGVRLGLTVSTIDDTGSDVDVTFSDGSHASYELVVGADGINSHVRSLLFPDAPAPKFTGQGCWRAVAPRPRGIEGPHIFLGGSVKAGVNPVSQTEMYLFVLQHVPTNPRMQDTDLHRPLADLLKEFGGPIGRVRDDLGPHSRVVYRPLERLLLPPPWYKGRVVLIGDAAHATTPHLASGAGIGLEDAIVLSESLAQETTIQDALQRFMERRFDRCKLVVENSARLGELEMQAAPIEQQAALSRTTAAALALPY